MHLKNWIQRIDRAVNPPLRDSHLPLWVLVGTIVFTVSTVFNAYGTVHFELAQYISYHLGPGSVWHKIFDNRTLDQGTYEGRELSYLVDHFDFVMIAQSVRWGFPVFISATHVILCIFIGIWVGWFAAKDLRLGPLAGLLIAFVFWTTPFVYIQFLLRTAKVLAAAGLVVLIVEIFRALTRRGAENERGLSSRFAGSILGSAWVLSFADRQGFFFLLAIIALAAVYWFFRRGKVAAQVVLLLVAVLGLELIYFFWIAPAFTRAFFGYDTDFSFNRMPLGELASKPAFFAGKALALLGDTIRFMWGGRSQGIAAVFAGAVMVWLFVRDSQRGWWRNGIPLSGYIFLSFGATWAMYALMILRHPPLLWPDMHLVYYWLPTSALLLLGTAFIAGAWIARPEHPLQRVTTVTALLACVFGNVAALPGHWRTFAHGHLADYIAESPDVRYALIHKTDPHYVAPREIETSRAYRTLEMYVGERSRNQAEQREFGNWLFYRRTRAAGKTLPFVWRFGGNTDPRFITSAAEFFELDDGRGFFGTTEGPMEMRVNLTTNRLHGEVVVQRTGLDKSTPVTVEFAIFAQYQLGARFPRWSARVELPVGQREIVVPYAIDSSHLYTTYTVDVPGKFAGKIAAGWRSPVITDVGGDLASPEWLRTDMGSVTVLDDNALSKLIGVAWRPRRAEMRNGRVTERGIELSPGGEIWLHADNVITRMNGFVEVVPDAEHPALPPVTGLWYKAGRMETYVSPSTDKNTLRQSFQSWCAEPGGWLVISLHANPELSPVLVHVTDVNEAR